MIIKLKSLRVTVFAAQRCLLYPGSKIGLTATGASQSNENFLTAFMNELIYKYSPFMKWLYKNGLIKTKLTDKGYIAEFWNGSIIYFFPCIDSSRGLHVDVLIGEELRLIKKADWDSIAMPMLVTRRAGFRNKPEYLDRIDLDEETKVICITSNRFKNEWFNTIFNNTFSNYFRNVLIENRVFCADIFLALEHGLKKTSWFLQQREEMDDLSFRMEILNETVGEVEGAYFTWEQFRKNQIIKKAFIPPNPTEFKTNSIKNREKKDNEIRLLFIDFAFASTTSITENDNTCIGCMSIIPKGEKAYEMVDYLETHGGSENDNTLVRIRELFWDYKADYIVLDLRNGGELNFNDLTKPLEHPMRSQDEWNNHGFTVALDSSFHMVPDTKLKDLRERTVDNQAVPCIIPITATNEFNSIMWMDLSVKLKNSEISFLIDINEFEADFDFTKEWQNMSYEDRALRKAPYIYTRAMINEAVNLTQDWKDGKLKLIEPRTGTKDSITALAMGNVIASKIINNMMKNAQNDDFDVSQWQLVF